MGDLARLTVSPHNVLSHSYFGPLALRGHCLSRMLVLMPRCIFYCRRSSCGSWWNSMRQCRAGLLRLLATCLRLCWGRWRQWPYWRWRCQVAARCTTRRRRLCLVWSLMYDRDSWWSFDWRWRLLHCWSRHLKPLSAVPWGCFDRRSWLLSFCCRIDPLLWLSPWLLVVRHSGGARLRRSHLDWRCFDQGSLFSLRHSFIHDSLQWQRHLRDRLAE